MALIRCWECKKQISDTAEACPHCGANQKKRPRRDPMDELFGIRR